MNRAMPARVPFTATPTRAPSRSLAMALFAAAAGCTFPPRVLPKSTLPIAGAYRLWSCDKPCAFTEDPLPDTPLLTLVLFERSLELGEQKLDAATVERYGARTLRPDWPVDACWSLPPPAGEPAVPGVHAALGHWKHDQDGVVRLITLTAPDAGAVLHLSVQGDTVTGSFERWSCAAVPCRHDWYAVDGVRIGPADLARCLLHQE